MIRAAGTPRVLMAGGGTGGHLFPGVAVAERLAERMPGARVQLAATAKDLASRHLAACPLEIVQLGSPKLPVGAVTIPGFGVSMARAVLRSYAFLRETDPEIVLGLGGYGSVAPVVAARARRIPTIVLEQNAVPGKATRLLGRFGAVAAASLPGIHAHGFRGRAVLTGNPIRRKVLETRRAHEQFALDPTLPVLGVLGGSLGARGMNERVFQGISALRDAVGGPFQVIHATGSLEDAVTAERAYHASGIVACVSPFFVDMGAVYGIVDVVLCRAGGTTVAELAALGIPAVFVPYPHHGDAHQSKNAEAFVKTGAATLVEESALTPEMLSQHVAPLLADPARRARRARAMRRMGRPDAADRVVDLILELTGYAEETSSPAEAAAAREVSQ
jgi:UDP-N-acetylglucosamine--N-acetylmuramyl-(pentapeptide) pyrophosphoryl-undecaprenol N-acetylglucosamine transferase